MKQVSAEVLNLDVQKLIEMLNAALCEEWLAYYQYWVGARVTEGPMRSEIESEMLKHADEELSHAVKLIDRIIQLGGTPVLSPDQWMKMARCKYEAPTDPYIETVLEQNLRGERCAIKRYQDIAFPLVFFWALIGVAVNVGEVSGFTAALVYIMLVVAAIATFVPVSKVLAAMRG